MDTQRVDKRLTDLEIKVSFTEDTIDRLNDVIVQQQRQIDLLTRELVELRRQQISEEGPAPGNPRDEIPPHF